MKTFLEPLLVMVALAATLRALESGLARWFAAAGAAVGLACLLRESHGVLLVPLALAAGQSGGSAGRATPRPRRAAGALLLGCALTLAPSVAHNWLAARGPVVSVRGRTESLLSGHRNGFRAPPFATSTSRQEHEDFREIHGPAAI
jgi:4-amino-4-deoxy-L-arabinose transferase-like glycosyltransferase